MKAYYCSSDVLRLLSCSNIQTLRWMPDLREITFGLEAPNSPHDFLFNFPSLQTLDIFVGRILVVGGTLVVDSMIHFVFCNAREQGVWRDIRSVHAEVQFLDSLESSDFFNKIVGHQQLYEKWWKEFTVTKGNCAVRMIGVRSG